jgi:ribose 5-phosphate isomerase A
MHAREYAAQAALSLVQKDQVLGLGTGRAVEAFIKLLPGMTLPKVIVSSSIRTSLALQALGIEVVSVNEVDQIDLYIDGADQVLKSGISIKGGGGAHTLEKCLANISKQFVGLVDEQKVVSQFDFPVAVEVIEQARSAVAREIAMKYGSPQYREAFKTDLGHIILDVAGMSLLDPLLLEQSIQMIPGVVEVGIFAANRFDLLYIGTQSGAEIHHCK